MSTEARSAIITIYDYVSIGFLIFSFLFLFGILGDWVSVLDTEWTSVWRMSYFALFIFNGALLFFMSAIPARVKTLVCVIMTALILMAMATSIYLVRF